MAAQTTLKLRCCALEGGSNELSDWLFVQKMRPKSDNRLVTGQTGSQATNQRPRIDAFLSGAPLRAKTNESQPRQLRDAMPQRFSLSDSETAKEGMA